MPYLIDGHNLIASLSDIRLDDPDDEAKLVIKLRGFAARTRKQCTVVFDGGLPGGASRLSTRGVAVVFAASRHSSADRLIMQRIRGTKDARNWTVVSSDQEIRRCARDAGMTSLSSTQFASELESSGRHAESRGEEIAPIQSEGEIEAWLAAFGGDDAEAGKGS